jgi:hypothetical protein
MWYIYALKQLEVVFFMSLHVDPAQYTAVRSNIFIKHSIERIDFSDQIRKVIDRIEANPIGCRLLKKISSYTLPIHIVYHIRDETLSKGLATPIIVHCSLENLSCFSVQCQPIPLPNYIVLFHELTHAYHVLSGKRSITTRSDLLIWGSDEEYHTIVGFPSKNSTRTTPKITENAFRRAEGLPERFGHIRPNQLKTLFDHSLLTRLKLLGEIHENLQASSFCRDAPPPIALCTKAALGGSNHWMIITRIQGINEEFTPTPKVISKFYHRYFLEADLDTCYVEDLSLLKQAQDELTTLFPKLQEVKHTVKALAILRCSQEEFDVVEL